MYRARLFSVRHASAFEWIYMRLERAMIRLDPLFSRLGYHRVERPVAMVERGLKSLLFDCRMCGQCVLSSTGMSCPMNCPKSIRNGPCGGVRLDGNCEIKPEMRCVWVEAWRGSQQMRDVEAIQQVQIPVNHLLKGSSSWLRVVREDFAVRDNEAAE